MAAPEYTVNAGAALASAYEALVKHLMAELSEYAATCTDPAKLIDHAAARLGSLSIKTDSPYGCDILAHAAFLGSTVVAKNKTLAKTLDAATENLEAATGESLDSKLKDEDTLFGIDKNGVPISKVFKEPKLFPLGPSVYDKFGTCNLCQGKPEPLAGGSICSACHDYATVSGLKSAFTEDQITLMQMTWAQAHKVSEPNTYGIDVGKPGGDKTVVAHLLGQKITFYDVPNEIKDSMIEHDGALYVPVGLHHGTPVGLPETLTIKAQKINISESVAKAVMKAGSLGLLGKEAQAAFAAEPKAEDVAKGKWPAVAGQALMTDKASGHTQLYADEYIEQGEKVFLSGPKNVTSKPKKSQVIAIGTASHSVTQGDPLWVKLHPSGVVAMEEAQGLMPEASSAKDYYIGTAGEGTAKHLPPVIYPKDVMIQLSSEDLGDASDELRTAIAGKNSICFVRNGCSIVFSFKGEECTMQFSVTVDTALAVKNWIQVRRVVNVDGSRTYLAEMMTGGHVQEVVCTQQVMETLAGKPVLKSHSQMAFEANGRKIMEFTADGKLVVNVDTYFSLNSKAIAQVAPEFAKQFWVAVEKSNPILQKYNQLLGSVSHMESARKFLEGKLQAEKDAHNALKSQLAKTNLDPSDKPSHARFKNVATMLDFPDMPEDSE